MQLSQDNGFLVFCACLAGVFLMLGSMCLQYGIAYAGLALCLPYQIAISISVGELQPQACSCMQYKCSETENSEQILPPIRLPDVLLSVCLVSALQTHTNTKLAGLCDMHASVAA